MAAALYMKLDSVVTTLKGWSLAAPIAQQLPKVECYFNKVTWSNVDELINTYMVDPL